MSAWQCALIYALLTSLHLPLIKRIQTGLSTGLQYVFINSVFSWPLLALLMVVEFALHHTVYFGVARCSFTLLPGWSGVRLPGLSLPYLSLSLHIQWSFWIFAFLTAWIQCAGLRRAVDAYGQDELSLVAPMGALMPIFVALFAWGFLHETLSPGRVVGIGAIVVGAYAILADNLRVRHLGSIFAPFKRLGTGRGLRVYLEARAIWVFFPLTLKRALDAVHPYSPYFVACVTVGAMCLYAAPWGQQERMPYGEIAKSMAAGFRRGPQWRMLGSAVGHGVAVLRRKEKPHGRAVCGGRLLAAFCLSALVVAAQQYVELTSYAFTDVAVASAIFKLDVPLAILWGVLFFHEKSPRRRLLSGLIMACGVWCLR